MQDALKRQIAGMEKELKMQQQLEEQEADYNDEQYCFLKNRLRQFDGEIQRN